MTARARRRGRIGAGIRTGTTRGSDKSKPWHFVDVEIADPRDHPGERLIALKFRLHLVGDLLQPLHAADDCDAGGNRKRVLVSVFRLKKSPSFLGRRMGRPTWCSVRSGR